MKKMQKESWKQPVMMAVTVPFREGKRLAKWMTAFCTPGPPKPIITTLKVKRNLLENSEASLASSSDLPRAAAVPKRRKPSAEKDMLT